MTNNSDNLERFLTEFNSGFHTSYRPTPKRLLFISKRLQIFSMDDLLQAVRNLSQSPWHTGENERGWKADPDFLLRNDEQVDKFLNYQPKPRSKWSTTGRF